ncbi:hypothetical protein [Chlorogloea sp. CCALA 695]|uniref:hypothetical protein n=1 Tax=Chlorogloea sp. CCALA 695 TaxID=2107693 RepID=UPI000D06B346|nr:hypothetical protein [Chlorogloea sp. CCALA 695]PSB30479.1 hypothetical protein C7B70_16120 [Chlorogloea sp. CCALA 695]
MKKLICATTFTLAIPIGIASLYAFSVPAFAGGVLREANAPHIVHSSAHPNGTRVPNTTHHFEVHVQGKELSQLSFEVPDGVEVSDRIMVSDQSGKKIDSTVSIKDKRATIAFSQPVPLETTLSISMKGAKVSFLSQGRTFLYPVYGKSVGMTQEIRIGIAQIQTY